MKHKKVSLLTFLLGYLKKTPTYLDKILLALLVVGFFCLNNFPQLQPIYRFLDSNQLSLKVGGSRFSLYFLIKGLVIVILTAWIARYLADLGERKLKHLLKMKASDRALIIKGFQIIVYAVAVLIGLDFLGVNITAFTVFGGAIGVGIGVGLQKITANFISGLILLFEKTISEGDMLELDGGLLVIVKRISARYTLVESFEKREIMIPNEEFITSRISNWTFSNRLGRGQIDLGVAYGSDLEKVSELLLELASNHSQILSTPEPSCYLTEFANSSVNFRLYFWVGNITEGTLRIKSDLLFAITKKFKEHGIEIPFPQSEIKIIGLPKREA